MAYVGFDKLKKKLNGKKGVKDASALAASIGRKKYGKDKFQKAAKKGKKMKGQKPLPGGPSKAGDQVAALEGM